MTLLFILFRFSLLVMVQIGFKPKIFTRKKKVAENTTRKMVKPNNCAMQAFWIL